MSKSFTGRRQVYIFLSEQDQEALKRLQAELTPSLLRRLVPVWVDKPLQSHKDWQGTLTSLLDDVRLVILFVSDRFLSSPRMAEELPWLLNAAKERNLPLLPVFLTPSQFSRMPLGRLRLFNDPTRPLSVNPPEDRELIWLLLREQVQEALERQKPGEPAEPADAPTLTLHGPTAEVHGLVWSPDGRWVAAASADSRVYLWEVATGHLALSLQDHRSEVQAIAWSPDGSRLASASIDRMSRVWDTTGRRLLTYTGHTDEVRSIAWSPDGQFLASASYDRTVQVWGATTGQLRLIYTGHADEVDAVAWAPDGTRIASGGGEPHNWKPASDTSVQVWEVTTGKRLLTYTGHTFLVTAVVWSPDGNRLASGSADQTVQVWDAVTGEHLHTWKGNFSEVCAVAWSPDGTRLAAAYADGPVRVWEVTTGKHLRAYRGHARYGALAVAWSPDGRWLASEGDDQVVRVWQAP